eukprot:2561960-Pleurochrysis_carterae.AAC.2
MFSFPIFPTNALDSPCPIGPCARVNEEFESSPVAVSAAACGWQVHRGRARPHDEALSPRAAGAYKLCGERHASGLCGHLAREL